VRELIPKILHARRHTYPSVVKFHKSTQLLTQSLYTECDDTFAYEEDDEAEERSLLELSSDGEDQHEAGMYVIFKMIRI
jgi:hypothetical protein